MPSIVYNHLIRKEYRKKYSIVEFLKNEDKISEICIFNLKII